MANHDLPSADDPEWRRSEASSEFARWLPTFDSDKYGLELLGPAVPPSKVAETLRRLVLPDPKRSAFIILRLTATGRDDVHLAMDAAASIGLGTRVCLSIDHPVLRSLDSTRLRDERVGLMLKIEDDATPLGALISDAIEALQIEPAFAQQLGTSIRGALLLEALRNLAHEIGLASLGPSLQQGKEGFGLPVRFDYVAEDTIVDVLAKHRLR